MMRTWWVAALLGLGGCGPAKSGGETGDGGAGVPAGCPRFGAAEARGTVARAELVEASGLAASGRHDGVVWSHNDDGDEDGVLYAIGADGSDRGSLRIAGAAPTDWEAIASDGAGQLYVGDIGDNDRSRDSLRIWQLTEPAALDQDQTAAVATPHSLRWPDVPRDAEALVVDPETGRPVVFSREPGRSVLLRLPASGTEGEVLGELSLAEGPLAGTGEVRGADVDPAGGVWVRTDDAVAWFPPLGGLAATLAGAPCPAVAPPEADGEAIAAVAGGYLTLGEGSAPTLWGVAEVAR